MPAAAKFDLTQSTARGDATNDFGSPIRSESDGRGATLRGSTGGGGPNVTAHTERGQVIIRKASAEDKPLMPRGESPTAETPLPAKPLKKVEQ